MRRNFGTKRRWYGREQDTSGLPRCVTCYHLAHDADCCPQDNCGWGEMVAAATGHLPGLLESGNHYVAGALYDRKGQLRKVPRL